MIEEKNEEVEENLEIPSIDDGDAAVEVSEDDDSTSTSEANPYSFAAEMEKPAMEEGMWERRDALKWVIDSVCSSDKEVEEKRSLIETALNEHKESVLSFLAQGDFGKAY